MYLELFDTVNICNMIRMKCRWIIGNLLPVQLGTVFKGLNMPSLSEQVKIPLKPSPTAGMSNLSEHCI